MSWDYDIVFDEHSKPRRYGPLCDWLLQQGAERNEFVWREIFVSLGSTGSVLVHFSTPRLGELSDLALRRHEADPRSDEDFWKEANAYRPADDEPVVSILPEGRRTGDITLVARWVEWMNATLYDCQNSRHITPREWIAEQPTEQRHGL